MANVYFLRKLAADELMDTLFFATGERVVKDRQPTYLGLSAGPFNIKIRTNRSIIINNQKYNNTADVKLYVQDNLQPM